MALVTGTRAPVSRAVTTKSAIPCRDGFTPVAMLVQMTGERIGRIVLRFARAPRRIRRAMFGMRPFATRASIRLQSNESTPISTTSRSSGSTPARRISSVAPGGAACESLRPRRESPDSSSGPRRASPSASVSAGSRSRTSS